MLSQRLNRITPKMADLAEYEEQKKARGRQQGQGGDTVAMTTQTPSPPPTSTSRTASLEHGPIQPLTAGSVRASTPEHQ